MFGWPWSNDSAHLLPVVKRVPGGAFVPLLVALVFLWGCGGDPGSTPAAPATSPATAPPAPPPPAVPPDVRGLAITTAPSNARGYVAGETIGVRVTFSEAVTVSGSPRLALGIGEAIRYASWESETSTGPVVAFRYEVTVEDRDEDGITVGADALDLNGGAIRNAAGVAADVSVGPHALAQDAGHRVLGMAPPTITVVVEDPNGDRASLQEMAESGQIEVGMLLRIVEVVRTDTDGSRTFVMKAPNPRHDLPFPYALIRCGPREACSFGYDPVTFSVSIWFNGALRGEVALELHLSASAREDHRLTVMAVDPYTTTRFERSLTDRPDELDGAQFHVVYALPSDLEDRELDRYGQIADHISSAQRFLASDIGHTLRFDTFEGDPDVSFSRLPFAEEEGASRGLRWVYHELLATLPDVSGKKYLVYYQGHSDDGVGGVGGGRLAILALGPHGAPSKYTIGLIIHEVFHALDAVPQCAPNWDGTGHVDDPDDLMRAGPSNPPEVRVDPGRDDYYGHGRTNCTDISTSPYFEPARALARMTTGATRPGLWLDPDFKCGVGLQ